MTFGEGQRRGHAAVPRQHGQRLRAQGREHRRHVVGPRRQEVTLDGIGQAEARALDDDRTPAVGLQAAHEIGRQGADLW